MKKLIVGLICVTMLAITLETFAFEGSAVQYQNALDLLKSYEIIAEEQQWKFDTDPMTRRDTLVIMNNITEAYSHIAIGQTMQDVLGFSFVDLVDGTTDAYLAMGLCRMGLFYGRMNEVGNHIADLDGYITNNEGLALLTRLLSVYTISSEYSQEMLRGLLGGGDDWLYVFAQRVTLINSDNPLDYGVTLSLDEKDEPMKASTFIRLTERALYTPITSEAANFALLYWIDLIRAR